MCGMQKIIVITKLENLRAVLKEPGVSNGIGRFTIIPGKLLLGWLFFFE